MSPDIRSRLERMAQTGERVQLTYADGSTRRGYIGHNHPSARIRGLLLIATARSRGGDWIDGDDIVSVAITLPRRLAPWAYR